MFEGEDASFFAWTFWGGRCDGPAEGPEAGDVMLLMCRGTAGTANRLPVSYRCNEAFLLEANLRTSDLESTCAKNHTTRLTRPLIHIT